MSLEWNMMQQKKTSRTFIHYISTKEAKHECDLLLHDGHYSCIRSLDRLLYDQNNEGHCNCIVDDVLLIIIVKMLWHQHKQRVHSK